MNITGAVPIMANKVGPNTSVMPISPGELEKLRAFMNRGANPTSIQDLSAYSLNQVQQSLDKYNQSQQSRTTRGAGKDGRSYSGGNAWQMPAGFGGGGDPRQKYKRSNYGIEDEFRYLTEEEGFLGDWGNMGIGNGNGGMPQVPPGLKPGDKGYNYEPNNNYNGTQGSGLPGRNGAPGIAGQQQQQGGNYDYSGYDAAALSAQVRGSGQVSTGFYNKAYGQSVEQGTSMFGMADLEGNLGAGITATQLKEFFDGGGASTLGANQQAGTGGIYDQVAAAAEAEKKVETQELPAPKKPGTMNIGPAMVGNGGNASGVRTKRSNDSKYGRNTRGTSQFNRGSFGNSRTSALTIGGLNI